MKLVHDVGKKTRPSPASLGIPGNCPGLFQFAAHSARQPQSLDWTDAEEPRKIFAQVRGIGKPPVLPVALGVRGFLGPALSSYARLCPLALRQKKDVQPVAKAVRASH